MVPILFKYKDDLVFFTFNYFGSIYMTLIFAVATGFSMLLICIFFLKQAKIKVLTDSIMATAIVIEKQVRN